MAHASGSHQMPGSLTEDPLLQLEISYLEASRRVSSNLYNHLAWMITSPELEPPDHLSILWNLVHSCPTVLLEDLKPSCAAPTWSSFQAFLIPDTTPAPVISYDLFFPKSPTNP
ncbi:unnamed protein product [Boreogadus saida]